MVKIFHHIRTNIYLLFSKISKRLFSQKSSGFVLIMVACFIPVVLAGIYYLEKNFKLTDVRLLKKPADDPSLEKRCAREAALAVARNWNPGLTLGQQKAAVYKVADAVYNAHPCYDKSALGKAIPGMITRDSVGNLTQLDAGMRTVDYETGKIKYIRCWYTTRYNNGSVWNVPFGMWYGIDKSTEPDKRLSVFDEVDSNFSLIHQDIFQEPHQQLLLVESNYPTNTYYASVSRVVYFSPGTKNTTPCDEYKIVAGSSYNDNGVDGMVTFTDKNGTYTERLDPIDGTSFTKIEVNNDAIKVHTDKQTARAVPAKCNVDIVLAVPVNGATSNIYGLDYASDPTSLSGKNGSPHTHGRQNHISDEVKQTPIYQMGQQLKNFVKTHFYHTRGVSMALIPYSGKLSVSPDRAIDWMSRCPPFVSDSTETQTMIGACLYGTSGKKDAPLTQEIKTKSLVTNDTLPAISQTYYWGNNLTGCPIMCRRGETKYWARTSNRYFSGLLLDTTEPNSSDYGYRYRAMNLNPCYAGYANLLSMRCERNCTHFLPNPYYMIEPTADLVKIYEMCNALYPIYDNHNVSNFIFAALEWANNMFQDWTRDPEASAVNSDEDSAQLSREHKGKTGRKKAIILLVNKPDWFEPGELTYLGFDNDFSEIPMAESDKIDFSINYSDTSKKFLDGTSYDGTIAGPKKIIRYERISGNMAYNEESGSFKDSGTSQIRLRIPHQGTVKVKVQLGGKINWRYYQGALSSVVSCSSWGHEGSTFPIAYGNGVFAIHSKDEPYAVYSTDGGLTWNAGISAGTLFSMTWTGQYFVGRGSSGSMVYYSPDGNTWSSSSTEFSGYSDYDLHWDGNYLFLPTDGQLIYATTLANGASGWSEIGTSSAIMAIGEQFKYLGGYYIHYYDTTLKYSTDMFSDYSDVTLPMRAGCLAYGAGYWLILFPNGSLMKSTNLSEWTIIDGGSSYTTDPSSLYQKSQKTNWCGLCYGDGKWVAVTTEGDIAVSGLSDSGNGSPPATPTIEFTNIGDATVHNVTGEQTFTIEPNKITAKNGDDYIIDFTATNIELVSAEVSNCVTDKVISKSTTYRASEIIGTGDGEVLSWSTRCKNIPERTLNLKNNEITNGRLSFSSDQMQYRDSTCGYVPKYPDSDLTVQIISDSNAALTLDVGKFTEGKVTFYSDNITDSISSTYDVRKDSTSGTSISLDTEQILYETQEFVFSGGSMPTNGQAGFHMSPYGACSEGKNFSHNLSVKKVRYLLSNSTITDCVLKNQIIRDYFTYYGYQHSESKALILNDMTIATKGSSGVYNPYSTYSYTSDASVSVGDSMYNNISKFRDSCIDIKSGYRYYANSYDSARHIGTTYGGMYVVVYGVTSAFRVSLGKGAQTVFCKYLTSMYEEILSAPSNNGYWYISDSCSKQSGYNNEDIKIYFDSSESKVWFYQFYVQNENDKTLQSTTPISVDPLTYQNLIENKGIYLANYNGENWICFQGDGELHVTVAGSSNTSYVKYGASQTNITSYSQSVTIPSSAFSPFGNDYVATITLHNANLKTVTQAGGNQNVKTLRSTVNNENIILIVEPAPIEDYPEIEYRSIASHSWKGITYGNDKFVAVGSSYVGISSNGSDWDYTSISYSFSCIDFDASTSTFFAATSDGDVYTSSDGTSWTSHSTAPISSVSRIACGDNYIVVQNYYSKQSASYNRSTNTWSSATIPAGNYTYALCYGEGKFISIPYAAYSASNVYASTDGLNWSLIGAGVMTSAGFEGAVCYGDGKFVSADDYDYAAYSTDGGVSWSRANCDTASANIVDVCYANGTFYALGSSTKFGPIVLQSSINQTCKIIVGNRAENEISDRTMYTIASSELSYDSNIGKYYIDLELSNVVCKKAAITYDKTETVDDLIDFNTSIYGKNGVINATVSSTNDHGYFRISGYGPSVLTQHRGKMTLKYAGIFDNDTSQSTSVITKTQLTHNNGYYSYNWSYGSTYLLLSLKFDFEPTLWYPYTMTNSLTLDWRNTSLTVPIGINISSYSNYNTTDGYHRLKTSGCSPLMYRPSQTPLPYASDITEVFDATSTVLLNVTTPEHSYTNGDTYFSGTVRLFSPQKRDSANTHCQLQPYSADHDNKVNMIASNFTVPVNAVLANNGYQLAGDTPTYAVSKVTAAACKKLKEDWGSDLKIYVIEYRAQKKYGSFPYYDQASTAMDHNYDVTDECATDDDSLYEADNETALKEVLDEIADDIKEWAGYEEAKIVE